MTRISRFCTKIHWLWHFYGQTRTGTTDSGRKYVLYLFERWYVTTFLCIRNSLNRDPHSLISNFSYRANPQRVDHSADCVALGVSVVRLVLMKGANANAVQVRCCSAFAISDSLMKRRKVSWLAETCSCDALNAWIKCRGEICMLNF